MANSIDPPSHDELLGAAKAYNDWDQALATTEYEEGGGYECVICAASMTLDSHELDPTPTCNTCAQEWIQKFAAAVPRLLHDLDQVGIAHQTEREARIALEGRRDELLVTVRKLSQETPLPDEVQNALSRQGSLLAEIGTLRSRLDENERRLAGLERKIQIAASPHAAVVGDPHDEYVSGPLINRRRK